MRKRLLTIFLIFWILSNKSCFGARAYLEKTYQDAWCSTQGGITEVTLPDKTRIDCMLPNYAIEFDFANKWAESIGQSLYYGQITNRTPGVVLIMENQEKDTKYLTRLEKVARNYGIKVWIITQDYLHKCK